MNFIKCRLCGFEFEKGVSVCRGCQGTIEYGAKADTAFGLGVVAAVLMCLILYTWLGVTSWNVLSGTAFASFVVGFSWVFYIDREAIRIRR